MKKGLLVMFILSVSILLLTACGPQVPAGEQPIETEAALRLVQTGTEGVVAQPLANYPPDILYDQNELIAIVEVHNKGNYDVDQQNCFVQVTGFDENILGTGLSTPRSCAENFGVLEGKNVYNTLGTMNQIEFRSPNVILPNRVFEYNPTLNFVTCYNYHTVANPEVCVDPLFYQVTSEQKTCVPTNVGMGGGQGAPVGVSYVGVDMVGSKAIFEINVVNNAGGRVLSPYSDIRSCGQASLDYTDLDKVYYTVDMLGGSIIDCKPRDGFVRLNNGNGKIVCSFNIHGSAAFTTPLLIDLDYNYVNSFTKPIKIIKTPE